MLPRAWNITAPSLRLRVDSAVPAAESTVGMRGLVSYRWELALGDTVLTAAEMARLVSGKSDLVQLRGEWVQADHKVLAAAARYVAAHTDPAPITLADMLGELGSGRVDKVPITEVTATGWAADLFDGHHEVEPVEPPVGLKAQLRPYQRRGVTWLATMSRMGCGAILADDMGLGKTIQVLALLLHEREVAQTFPRIGADATAPPGRRCWSARCRWSATGTARRSGSRPTCEFSSTTASGGGPVRNSTRRWPRRIW